MEEQRTASATREQRDNSSTRRSSSFSGPRPRRSTRVGSSAIFPERERGEEKGEERNYVKKRDERRRCPSYSTRKVSDPYSGGICGYGRADRVVVGEPPRGSKKSGEECVCVSVVVCKREGERGSRVYLGSAGAQVTTQNSDERSRRGV